MKEVAMQTNRGYTNPYGQGGVVDQYLVSKEMPMSFAMNYYYYLKAVTKLTYNLNRYRLKTMSEKFTYVTNPVH